MPITVKYSGAMKFLKGVFAQMQDDFRSQAAKTIGQTINEEILSGTSPVKGQGRFQDYSDSYKAQIQGPKLASTGKRLRPVNLKVTGDMLGSQEVTISRDAGVTVRYTDKKATYHNTLGAGKSGVLRRMLPTKKGEEFSRTIMSVLKNVAAASVAKIIRR